MATLNLAITDSADDGYEYGAGGEFAATNPDFYAGFDTDTANYTFLRFQNVTITQGATINSATLTLNLIDVTGSPNTTWYGVAADNAAAFAAVTNIPSSSPHTTASAAFVPVGTGTKAINVATIVQEIVNRGGWASGNALALVNVDNVGAGAAYWAGEDLTSVGTAHATLDIDYTAGGAASGGGVTAATLQQRQKRYGYGHSYIRFVPVLGQG